MTAIISRSNETQCGDVIQNCSYNTTDEEIWNETRYIEELQASLEQHFNVTGTPRAWMASYLSDRFQTVCIDGELPLPALVEYSVPQGSVLDSKNYVLFIKPLGDVIRRDGLQHHFYADDTNCTCLSLPMMPSSRLKYWHALVTA